MRCYFTISILFFLVSVPTRECRRGALFNYKKARKCDLLLEDFQSPLSLPSLYKKKCRICFRWAGQHPRGGVPGREETLGDSLTHIHATTMIACICVIEEGECPVNINDLLYATNGDAFKDATGLCRICGETTQKHRRLAQAPPAGTH
jgi:hypothetical protein